MTAGGRAMPERHAVSVLTAHSGMRFSLRSSVGWDADRCIAQMPSQSPAQRVFSTV